MSDFPAYTPSREPLLRSLSDIAPDVLAALRADLRLYLEMNPPSIPLAQMAGFSRLVYQLTDRLPSNPADGQWVAINLGNNRIWQFRYFSKAFTDQYRWVYVGGTSVVSYVADAFTTTSGTYVSGGGPSISGVPFAGVYAITLDAALRIPAAGGDSDTAWASVSIAGATPSDTDALILEVVNPNTQITVKTFKTRTLEKTLAAGNTLEMKYRTNAASATFSDRRLVLVPIRVG